jgi:hypothetical protein
MLLLAILVVPRLPGLVIAIGTAMVETASEAKTIKTRASMVLVELPTTTDVKI